MNELNISNKALLDELDERIKKGEIKLQGRQLVTKSEKGNGFYHAYTLKIDVGYLVNAVIGDLKDEIRIVRQERERFERELVECKKQLKTGS